MKQEWEHIAGVCYVKVEEKHCLYLKSQKVFLEATEAFLKHHLQGCQPDDTKAAVLKAIYIFMFQAGDLIVKAAMSKQTRVEFNREAFAKVEGKLIEAAKAQGTVMEIF